MTNASTVLRLIEQMRNAKSGQRTTTQWPLALDRETETTHEYIPNLLQTRARTPPEPAALHLTRRCDLLELELPQLDISLCDLPGDPIDGTPYTPSRPRRLPRPSRRPQALLHPRALRGRRALKSIGYRLKQCRDRRAEADYRIEIDFPVEDAEMVGNQCGKVWTTAEARDQAPAPWGTRTSPACSSAPARIGTRRRCRVIDGQRCTHRCQAAGDERQLVPPAANRVGRKGSRFIVAFPSATSSITSFPSSGARVTPLWVTQR